jgi:hypothetical protein
VVAGGINVIKTAPVMRCHGIGGSAMEVPLEEAGAANRLVLVAFKPICFPLKEQSIGMFKG